MVTKNHRKRHKTNNKKVIYDNDCFAQSEQFLIARFSDYRDHMKQLATPHVINVRGTVKGGILNVEIYSVKFEVDHYVKDLID